MEKDKLGHVTHSTNYSKLFELCVGKFALSSEGFGNAFSNLRVVEMFSRHSLFRCSNIFEKVSLATVDLVCGTPRSTSKFTGAVLPAWPISLLRYNVFLQC